MTDIRYVKVSDGYLAAKAGDAASRSGNKPLLLGMRLHLDLSQAANGWAPARTMPDEDGNSKSGFVQLAQVSHQQQLKIFYMDVGQGDATLIEAEGGIVIIDGGPNRGFHEILTARLESLQRADEDAGLQARQIQFINAVIVTHFDKDHFYGLTRLFNDPAFEVGTLYHNGLPRYGFNTGKDLDLGDVINHRDGTRSIATDLTGFTSGQEMLDDNLLLTENGNDNLFAKFLQAVIGARDAGRLGSMQRLYRRKTTGGADLISGVGNDLQFEILGPITTRTSGSVRLPAFPDPHDVSASNPNPRPSESHTVNGNSVVLRLRYKGKHFLFGGDLNQPAQKYLDARYGATNPFRSDVNKACHHGSSDFDLAYLKSVAPDATVFSSGDDGSYDHPLPDAMGTAARHSNGEFPLVFSTELARDNKTSGGIKLGHINARSNGNEIVMAQKKERASTRDPWHKFPLPYPGPFGGH